MKVGVFPLKALPPHVAHMMQIIQAVIHSSKIYVVVSDSEERMLQRCEEAGLPPIPLELRKEWMEIQLGGVIENLEILTLDEAGLPPYPDGSSEWCQRLRDLIPEPIDLIFGGDKEYAGTYAKHLPEAQYIKLDRSEIPISSTEIRADWKTNFHWILACAQPFFEELWRNDVEAQNP